MKQIIPFIFSFIFWTNNFGQTVSTLVPTNVGDDMHFAADGYIYSSHYGGYYFRKINPNNGEVDTILTVNTPTIGAIEMDDNLNIYTCSYELGWVGKFAEGDDNITNITSGLSGPAGIAHDADGNLYVATNQNHRIIKVLLDGTKETFVQGSPLFWPTGITIDTAGNLYVANMFSGQIVKVTPEKQMVTLATLPAVSDQTPDLAYLTWTHGKLYICHFDKHVIYEMDPETGDHQIIAGSGQPGNTDGPALQASFNIPTGIVASPSGDTLYITDGVSPNQRLRMLVLGTTSAAQEPQANWFNFISLFPTPASDKLTLEFEMKMPMEIGFQVVDSTGKKYLSQSFEKKELGKQTMEFPISHLPPGMCYLIVDMGGYTRNFSFVKS